MQVTTDALDGKGYFDPRYTSDFDNSSPELRWDGAPDETQCFALIAEDPDARSGVFTHWIIFNIPAQIRHLPAGIPAQETLPNGIRQGVNSFGKLGYTGPYPPVGDGPHRYYFKIFALNLRPEIPNRATREQLLEAILPHTIAKGEVMGLYERAAEKIEVEKMIKRAG